MAVIGYANNTTLSDIVLTNYTVVTGVNVVFYDASFYTEQDFIDIADYLDSGDIILQDLYGVDLSADDAKDSFVDACNEISEQPPFVLSVRPLNNSVSKYIVGYLLDYIEGNAVSNSDAASKYDLVNDLVSAMRVGSKPISLGHVSNLTDPFYTTLFKDTITDYINTGFHD